jgi:DNA-binding HxlR family transcriptional regulator
MEENINIGCGTYRFVINKTNLNLLLNLEYGAAKINEMAKKVGMSYGHLTVVLQEFQKEGIILKKTAGKDESSATTAQSYDIELTPKGQKLTKALSLVKNIIEETDKKVVKQ